MCAYPVSRPASRLRQTPHHPGVQLLASVLFGAPRVCRGPLRVCHARYVAPREPHAQRLTSRTHRACAYPMSPCFVVVRALGCARRRGTFHRTRTCFSQRALTNSQPISQSIKHTQHAREMKCRELALVCVRVVLHQARCHARSGLPRDRRDATSYHAFARDTEPSRLAQHKASHQRRVARTSTGCYKRGRARTLYSQRALIRLATSMMHRSFIREPHQAHASHKAARIGSSYAWVVCPSSCRCGVLARIPQTDVSALFVFSSENSVEWVRCSSCMNSLWRLWCRLATPRLMPSESRMGLCGCTVPCLLCDTRSVSWSPFFNAELFFFSGMSLRTPCDKVQF